MNHVAARPGRTLLLAMLALAVVGVPAMAQAPSNELVARLSTQVGELNRAGRYGEAVPIAQRALRLAEQLYGPDHPDVGSCVNNLAELYRALGRYADAEPLYRRALAIWEKALGPDHADVAIALNNLALLYKAAGRLREAEPLYRRAMAIWERELGPDHLDVGRVLSNLGELYREQGRYAEAEPLYKRSIAIREKALGPDDAAVATALNNLALLKTALGRYAEAEPLYLRALCIWENSLGLEHPYVGTALDNLAELYRAEGRYGEAEPLYKRSLAIREKAYGPNHPYIATTYNNLALLYDAEGRAAEAEPLFKHALALRETLLGANHADVAASLNNLAEFYRDHGNLKAAEPLQKRALAIWRNALGPEHPDVATALNNLGNLYLDRQEFAEAESYYRQALTIRRKVLSPDHPDIAGVLNNLAWLAFEQKNWARAVDHWRQSTDLLIQRTRHGGDKVGEAPTGKVRSDAEREANRFAALIKAAHRLARAEPTSADRLGREMFRTAQWSHLSEAASSLNQMALRTAAGDDDLTRLIRERQDLVGEWHSKEIELISAHSAAPSERDAAAEQALAARLAAIDARLAEIDGALTRDFASYAAFAQPEPMTTEQVQQALNADEALVLLFDTRALQGAEEETFVWVITKSEMRWVRSALGTGALAREVAALRCGLDYEAAWVGASSRCPELLKTNYTELDRQEGKALPFDAGRAHALYAALLQQVEDIIKDKHLLIVPSGALTQLPFHVLVTAKPVAAGNGVDALRRTMWLAKSHALTVLPSVASLKALRQLAKPSHASRTFIGFGDPLLDGPDARYDTQASLARSKQSCPKLPELRVAALSVEQRTLRPLQFHGGLVDAAAIRAQVPLPETADELCAVARDLGVAGEEVRLGERATETEVKRLSEAGELAQYRVIHFATHGALAGQVSHNAEPGLLLTPPSTASELDDGYLSASEIAALRLDADWVILSACNTAAGGAEGTEALSGLARAFFYAGSRALLVSHWAVDSDATVKLITRTLRTLAEDKSVGRSEALRRSILALIEGGHAHEAHPAIWAPFVLAGEGSAASH